MGTTRPDSRQNIDTLYIILSREIRTPPCQVELLCDIARIQSPTRDIRFCCGFRLLLLLPQTLHLQCQVNIARQYLVALQVGLIKKLRAYQGQKSSIQNEHIH